MQQVGFKAPHHRERPQPQVQGCQMEREGGIKRCAVETEQKIAMLRAAQMVMSKNKVRGRPWGGLKKYLM